MKQLKRFLVFLLTAVLAVGTVELPVFAAELPFTDVKRSDWFYPGVEYTYESGIILGTTSTSFSPHWTTTRAMAVTVLYRIEGASRTNKRGTFTDVQADSWCADAVEWAAANGVVNGYHTGAFGPSDPITREQLAAILHRYCKLKGLEGAVNADLSGFTDASRISDWAVADMKWANANDLILGSNRKIDPKGYAARSQLATILMRLCKNIINYQPVDLEKTLDLGSMPPDFLLASGSGGWHTSLRFMENGEFQGEYVDSNLGDTGPGYPNGTTEVGFFKGRIKHVTTLRNGSYMYEITNLESEYSNHQDVILDGTRYHFNKYTGGLTSGSLAHIYTPSADLSALSQEEKAWIRNIDGNGWIFVADDCYPYVGIDKPYASVRDLLLN